jgi:hypothetical protein
MREAFPWDSVPRNLLRDRDRIFSQEFGKQVKAMGIKRVLSAPRSLWQRAYVERVIGTIRRKCLDRLIVFNKRSVHRHLQAFVDYYHQSRVHLALEKDPPEPRRIRPPECGRIVSILVLGDCITDTSRAPRKSSTSDDNAVRSGASVPLRGQSRAPELSSEVQHTSIEQISPGATVGRNRTRDP